VVDAQVGAPFMERQAELVVEQPAEGPCTRPDPAPEFGKRAAVRWLLIQDAGNRLQPVVVRLRQVERPFIRIVQLIDEHAADASKRSSLQFFGSDIVRAGTSEIEERCTSEIGQREHDRMIGQASGERWRQEQDPHVRFAVCSVTMRIRGRRPGHPVRRHDPGAALRVERENPASGIDEVPLPVDLQRAGSAGRPEMCSRRRPHT